MTENEIMLSLGQFAKGAKKAETKDTKLALMYTRVSSKEQSENLSLDVQSQAIRNYAERNGYSILESYGGTYESAKNEERVEFQKMMEYVRRNKKSISAILLYSMDRFSRSGANAIYLSDQLRKQGTQIIAVTQPTNTYEPSGELHQNIMLVFSHFDNQQRRAKTIAGMAEKVRRGYWVSIAPKGYKYCGTKEKKLVHSEVAPLIKRAFEMKARGGFTNVEILHKLKLLGLNIKHKSLSKIFCNVTYIGYLSHALLDGEIIKGKHEPIIDEELFFQVNKLKRVIKKRIKETEANEFVPLKNFIQCPKCKIKRLTGYEVSRRRGNWYYKCSTKGCKINVNVNQMHNTFYELLKSFTIKPSSVPEVKKKLRDMMMSFYTEQLNDEQRLIKELNKHKKKIDVLDERFAYGEIEKDLYKKVASKEKKAIAAVEKELLMLKPNSIPNMDQGINEALALAQSIHTLWLDGDVYQKRRLQKVIFPKGLVFRQQDKSLEPIEVEKTLFAINNLNQ